MSTLRTTWMAVFLLSTCRSACAADSSTEVGAVASKVDEYMQACIKRNHFSGSVLVARHGELIVAKGYGLANREHNVPNTPHTKFRIGSITKQFTAMAVMILHKRGKLNPADTIQQHLPDCPEAWDQVTIHQLLTHTSGIPNFTDFPEYLRNRVRPATVAETISQFRDKPLEFTPGERFKYSNSGYVVIEALIEKLSGKTYEQFVRLEIFEPLKMSDTGCDHSDAILMHRAAGYEVRGNTVINAPYIDTSGPHANGGLYSTVGDLFLWDRSLTRDTLLPIKSIEQIFTPQQGSYGYGWHVGTRFSKRMQDHGGGTSGFSTRITRYPDDGVCVIVLSNLVSAPVQSIDRALAAIVFGESYELPRERTTTTVNPKILDVYVGKYQLPPAATLTVRREGDRLLVQASGDPEEVEVFPESETSFFYKENDLQIEFVKDPSGKVNRLIIHDDGRDYPGLRIIPD